MDEMKKASEVMRQVLSAPPTSASLDPISTRPFLRGEWREC
jgi:hypothetical protein